MLIATIRNKFDFLFALLLLGGKMAWKDILPPSLTRFRHIWPEWMGSWTWQFLQSILHIQVKAVSLFSNFVLKSCANRVMSGEELRNCSNGHSDWLAHNTSVSEVCNSTFVFCQFPWITLLWSQLKLSSLKLIAFASWFSHIVEFGLI